MLDKHIAGAECCRLLVEKGVVEKCYSMTIVSVLKRCRGALRKRVIETEKCWKEVLEKNLAG